MFGLTIDGRVFNATSYAEGHSEGERKMIVSNELVTRCVFSNISEWKVILNSLKRAQ